MMKCLNRYKAVLIVIIIGLVSLPSIVKDLKVLAQNDKSPRPPDVTCYKPQAIVPQDKKLSELQKDLKQLEQLHHEGKINTETYTTRKEILMFQIEHKQGDK